MATTPITLSLTVPELPDNDIWFLNAAAWNNYWLNGVFSANIPIADTVTYGLVMTGNNLVYTDPANTPTKRVTLNLDGIDYAVLQAESFDELRIRFEALVVSYQNLRNGLKAANLINNAQ